MVAEPRNAASEAGKTMTELMLDHERFDEVLAMVADDFVQQDRRKLAGAPDMDKAAWTRVAAFILREAIWIQDTGRCWRSEVIGLC